MTANFPHIFKLSKESQRLSFALLTYFAYFIIDTCTFFNLFQATAGSQTVTVTVGNMTETADSSFTYDNNLTPQISGVSPQTTTVIGELRIISLLVLYVFLCLITIQ